MNRNIVLAIDQGTTGTTCLLVEIDEACGVRILGRGYAEFPQHFPRPGWVEHSLEDIWQSFLAAYAAARDDTQLQHVSIAAIGITNQRETTCVWDRHGTPLARAIVWQDRRTAATCQALKDFGQSKLLQERTGLVIDPYFSGTKLGWLLKEVPGLKERAARGAVCFGTVDSWLLFKLTAGAVHATDATNAARTQLFDIHRQKWDAELCALLGDIPPRMLPNVLSCNALFGKTRNVPHPDLSDGIAIHGIAGDQQAALFGQACVHSGMVKCTYGTGAFILVNTGDRAVTSTHGLLTTLAWRIDDQVTYALEGSIFVAGAVVQWLRDGLGLIARSSDVEALAQEVTDSGGVVMVPALTGLGAPNWRPQARGLISGITRGTQRGHIARAALEGIALQVYDLVTAMREDSGIALPQLRVDGGASANNLLMQYQADVLGVTTCRPRCIETTALGAAYLAALGTGIFSGLRDVAQCWHEERTFTPQLAPQVVQTHVHRWRQAIALAG